MWFAVAVAVMLATAVDAQSPTGKFTNAECEQLARQRNIDTRRQHHITRAVLCDTQPAACVTEMLFAHEFYWTEAQAAAKGGIKCAKWARDDQWPTVDPHLTRSPDLGGLWEEVLTLMPNRTLWLHGDSITTQVCEASFCSLARSAVVPQPMLCSGPPSGRHPSTVPCPEVDAVGANIGMQLRAVRLPNGAKVVCSAVGVLERDKIATVLRGLPDIGVAVLNYGLHYHSSENFGLMLDELMTMLTQWASQRPGRVPLWRELNAQHFKGGSWSPGAHKPPPGTPCQCEPLAARDAISHSERTLSNQNVAFNSLAASKAAATGVGVVPFFNLTVPRFDMHRRHFCSYSNQQRVGRCCDCTHLCYTPLLWDTFFRSLRRSVLAHPGFASAGALPMADEGAASTRRRRGRGAGGRRGRASRRWRFGLHKDWDHRSSASKRAQGTVEV